MVRNILSIILGYAIFVITALGLFKFSGENPHSDPTTVFVIVTAIYGVASSFTAGLITQIISKSKKLKLNFILALIIAGFATFSLSKSDGNHWTQLLAIFIFAPASILGGLIYKKRIANNSKVN